MRAEPLRQPRHPRRVAIEQPDLAGARPRQ